MKKYINNQKYISCDELARLFTNDYEVNVTMEDIHRLVDPYCRKRKNSLIQIQGEWFYNEQTIWDLRHIGDNAVEFVKKIKALQTPIIQNNKQTEDDLEYNPNFNVKSVDKWYRPNQINIKLNESQYNRLFENIEDEGGIFHFSLPYKSQENDNPYDTFNAKYEYLDNVNDDNADNKYIYYDYSKVFDPSKKYKGWVKIPKEVVEQWGLDINKIPQLQTHNSTDYSAIRQSGTEYRLYNGDVYMPKRVRGDIGDNFANTKSFSDDEKGAFRTIPVLYIGDEKDENGEYIEQQVNVKVLNLTSLGRNSAAVHTAHVYKGKEIAFKKGTKINPISDDKYINREAYNNNLLNTAKHLIQKYMPNFNPTFIVAPASSSKFNIWLKDFFKNQLYPNAFILPSSAISKQNIWRADFNDMIHFTDEEISNNKTFTSPHAYKTYLLHTTLSRFIEMESTVLLKILRDKIKNGEIKLPRKYKQNYVMSKIVNGNTIKEFNTRCWYFLDLGANRGYNNFKKIFQNYERTYLNKKFNLPQNDTIFNDWITQKETILGGKKCIVDEDTLFDYVFLKMLNNIFSNEKYGSYHNDFSRKKGGREQLYRNIEEFKNTFLNSNPMMWINYTNVMSDTLKADVIKHYDNVSRWSLDGQFYLDDKNKFDYNGTKTNALSVVVNNPDKQYLILDDNYSSGASLRNASQILVNNGVNPNNILCITPGDMGDAGTGGKKGRTIPQNFGSFNMQHLYGLGKLNTDGYNDNEIAYLKSFRRNDDKFEKLNNAFFKK